MLRMVLVNKYYWRIMKQKILITGGFGFVGSELTSQLSRYDDIDVTILDNLLSGTPLDSKFIEADIRNANVMDKLIPQFDVIIHLAAIVGEPACVIDPIFAFDVNVKGTRNILNAMRANQKIIFTSTSSVYGNRPNELVSEESTPKPLNNYARQKYTSELDIIASKHDYVIVRPVTAFGITQRTRIDLLVNTLIYEALSTGKIEIYEPNIMRPIIHVIDFVRILIGAVNGHLGQDVYNIGDPFYSMNKAQLAKEIAMLTGATLYHTNNTSLDPRNYDISFQKLIDTGFRFGGNRLSLAVQQIKAVQDTIAQNPNSFSVPHKVEQFLKESH